MVDDLVAWFPKNAGWAAWVIATGVAVHLLSMAWQNVVRPSCRWAWDHLLWRFNRVVRELMVFRRNPPVVVSPQFKVKSLEEPPGKQIRQLPPHIFVGHACIEGQEAPDGVLVEAHINGVVQGNTTVMKGMYTLPVNSGSEAPVLFFVDGRPVPEMANWMQGGATMMDLYASVG